MRCTGNVTSIAAVFGAALVNSSCTSWQAMTAPSMQVEIDLAMGATRCLVLAGQVR